MYIYIYIYVYLCIFIYAHMYVCMYACMHACMHARILYVCVSVGCGMILKPRMFLQPKPGDSETKTDDSETKKTIPKPRMIPKPKTPGNQKWPAQQSSSAHFFSLEARTLLSPPTAPVAWTVPFYVTAPLVKK